MTGVAANALPRRIVMRRLDKDQRGTTVLEFGLVAPILSLMLMGALDFAHTLYMQAVLQGTVQKAARDSTLETSGSTSAESAIDQRVATQVRQLFLNAPSPQFRRRFFKSFSQAAAAQAESWTDVNGNGTCDGPSGSTPGEPYVDANNNRTWDRDGGDAGGGGARDVVVYTVTVQYPHLFPVFRFIGASDTVTLSAQTVLTNQPWDDQAQYGAPTVRNCP